MKMQLEENSHHINIGKYYGYVDTMEIFFLLSLFP